MGSVALAAALLAQPWAPANALADGDPASDLLLAAPAFYPYEPTTSAPIRRALEGELAQLRHAGLNLKVAIIDSPTDLGLISNLWRLPQQYAVFLGREISFNQKQPLLVVMPAGFGVSGVDGQPALNGLPVDTAHGADGLARSVIAAVARLAHANGKVLAEPSASVSTGGGGKAPALLVFGAPVLAVALVAVFALRRRSRGGAGSDDSPAA